MDKHRCPELTPLKVGILLKRVTQAACLVLSSGVLLSYYRQESQRSELRPVKPVSNANNHVSLAFLVFRVLICDMGGAFPVMMS